MNSTTFNFGRGAWPAMSAALRVSLIISFVPSLFGAAPLPDYNVGEVPPQQAWYDQTNQFLVRSDQLGDGATISVSASPVPLGPISFDPVSRRFMYAPHPRDKNSFDVQFTAVLGNSGVSQTVKFEPIPRLRPEQDVLGAVPRRPMPNPESKDYIVRGVVTNTAAESFNNQTRMTRNITISGKTVVFQDGHPNGLYDYNENDDIKQMTLYAEVVVVRSPLRLPQTMVTIFAKDLQFEDAGMAYAVIDTSPRSLTTRPAFSPGATNGTDGIHGLRAGDVTLFISRIVANPCSNRFILLGGHGQPAGLGRDGTDGSSMVILPVRGLPPGNSQLFNHITYINLFNILGEHIGTAGDGGNWPGDGGDAVVPGKPGNPGNGGNIASTLDVRDCGNNSGGRAGQKAPDTHGGAAGSPNPAYRIGTAVCLSPCPLDGSYYLTAIRNVSDHTASAGRDAQAPDANVLVGSAGSFAQVGNSNSWFSPSALRAILAHSKDAYLYGYCEAANDILTEYASLLDAYRSTPEWNALPDEWQLEFRQIRDELGTLLYRISANLDYFGNPAGWVPMLSFEANKLAFEGEVSRAIRVLYLRYWVANASATLQQKVAALATARERLKDEIEQFNQDFDAAATLLPDLVTKALTISAQLDYYQDRLQQLEQDLIDQARDNIARRNQIVALTRNAGVILNAFPYGQPVAGRLGSIISIFGDVVSSDSDWGAIRNFGRLVDVARNIKDQELKDASENWKTNVATINFRIIETNGVRRYLTNLYNFGRPIYDAISSVRDRLEKTKVPQSDVDEEFARLKASYPEFNVLAQEIDRLMVDKETFSRQLAAASQAIASLSEGVTKNTLAIDGLNRDVSFGNAVIDHRALVYLDDMEKRAKERLLKYHYYLAKAYEYRLLQAYPGELDLTRLFERFRDIVQAGSGHELNATDFDSLKAIYEEQISTIAADIFQSYDSNRPEFAVPIRFRLLPEQLQMLNRYEPLRINLVEMGLLALSEENIRISDFKVHDIRAHVVGTVSNIANLTLYMEHSGESKLARDGADYLFRHFNQATQSPILWGARYDALTGIVDPIVPSPAQESLLRSLLIRENIPGTDDNILLYSRPGGWADIVIYKQSNSNARVAIEIDDLLFEVSYDFMRQRTDQARLEVLVSDSQFTPHFVLDRADVNGRQDGRGELRRTYTKGQRVTLQAPLDFGFWRFQNWTDRFGNSIGGNSTTNPILPLQLTGNLTVRAEFAYNGPAPIGFDGPAVAVQPAAQAVFLHEPATFDSVAFNLLPSGGTPVSYQWQFNGSNILGATNATFGLTDATPTNVGSYSVVVNTGSGVLVSAAARLTVNSPPIITAQPQNRVVVPGSSISFSVSVIGSEPFAFQWQFNGTDILGATSTTFTLANVTHANIGNYSVRIANEFGTVSSATATLTVNQPPSFIRGSDVAVDEDAGPQTIVGWATNIRAGPPEESGQALMFLLNTDNSSLFSVVPAIDSTRGNLTFTSAPNGHGLANVTVVLMDDGGGNDKSAPQTFIIRVRPVNDCPVVTAQAASVEEDTTLSVRLAASDADGDTLTYTIVTTPAHGILSGTSPNLSYTPTTNYCGSDGFTFRVSDGQCVSSDATVSIMVNCVNDLPTARFVVSPIVHFGPHITNLIVISTNNANDCVLLDGSTSSDVEPGILRYCWFSEASASPFSTEARTVGCLGLGVHAITLAAKDAEGGIGSVTKFIEVITTSEATLELFGQVDEADLGRQNKQPFFASLNAAIASFERGNTTSAVNQLGVFQNKVRAQLGSTYPALTTEWTRIAQLIIDAVRRP
jgi:hypothetical protein